jgi:hypothetical protein
VLSGFVDRPPGAVLSSARWWLLAAATSLALGYVLEPETLLLVVAGLVGLTAVSAASTTALRVPALGLHAMLLVAVLLPMNVREHAPISLSAVMAAAVCATAVLRRFRERQSTTVTRTEWAAATFLLVAILAFIVGQYPWFEAPPAPIAAQLGGLGLFVLSSGLLLAVGREMRSVAQVRRLTWFFLVASGAAVSLSILQVLVPGIVPVQLIDASTLGSMFWTWTVAMGASQALCNRSLGWPWRIALGLLTLFTLARGYGLAFSWTSGWLPPSVALAIVVAMRFPRLALGLGLIAATPMLLLSGVLSAPVAEQESYSIMTRLEAIRVMWQVIERNPWLGVGPANYYHYTLQFPILGWYVRFNSHNQYLDLIAQVGVIGLLAFLWVGIEGALTAWRLRSGARSWFVRAYGVGVVAGTAASLVAAGLADWIVPFVYNIGMPGFRSSLLFWFFLGGAVALRRMMFEQTEPAGAAILE